VSGFVLSDLDRFVLGEGQEVERGVQAAPVEEHLDVVEHGSADLACGWPTDNDR
jgi:hypothetical protein